VVRGAAVTRLHTSAGLTPLTLVPCATGFPRSIGIPDSIATDSAPPPLPPISTLFLSSCLAHPCVTWPSLPCPDLQSLDSGPGHRSDDALAGAHAGHESGGGGGSGGAAFLTMVGVVARVCGLKWCCKTSCYVSQAWGESCKRWASCDNLFPSPCLACFARKHAVALISHLVQQGVIFEKQI
jgi:hypothetical protein